MMIAKLRDDLKTAQLQKVEIKVSTLRLLLSEIHNLEIQKGGELTNEDYISVIQREAKKRKEAIAGFRQGGRDEQAKQEEAELKILEEYLPEQMTNEELTQIIDQAINKLGAKSIAEMGKVMAVVMSKTQGRSDGSIVSQIVKEKLS